MATWTASELANAVLKRLGIVGAGQTASAEDAAVVTDAWTSLHPYLRRHGLAAFTSGAISEDAQVPLEKWVADQVADVFGFTGERRERIKQAGNEGWRQLQEVHSADRTFLPSRASYF